MIVEDCEEIDDNEHIIYVNGKCQNNGTELGWLMHDFFCKDPQDMHYMVLAKEYGILRKTIMEWKLCAE